MRIKRTILAGCIMAAAALLVLLAAAPRVAGPRLLERGRHEAETQGIRFELEEPKYSWTGLSGRALRISIVRRMFFTQLELSDFAVRPSPAALFRGNLACGFSGKLLNGHLRGTAAMRKQTLDLDFTVAQAQLAGHPQLQAAGVTSGTLSMVIERAAFSPAGPLRGSLDLTVNGLTRRRSMFLGSLEQSLNLPEIQDASLRLKLTPLGHGEWGVSLESKSNLAKLTASGVLSSRALRVSGSANFTPDGAPLKAAFMRLGHAPAAAPRDEGRIEFRLSGTLPRPVLQVTGQ